jgi:hypothetical protein
MKGFELDMSRHLTGIFVRHERRILSRHAQLEGFPLNRRYRIFGYNERTYLAPSLALCSGYFRPAGI